MGDYGDFTFVTYTYSGAGYADVGGGGGISTTPSPAVVGFPGNPVVEGTCAYVTRTEVLCHEPLPKWRINFLTIVPEVNGSTVDYPIVDYGSPDLGVSVFHIQVIRKLQGTNWATGFVDANLNHYMALANGNLGDFDVGVTMMTGETGPAVVRKVSIGNDLSESESYLNYPALTWTGMFDLNPVSLDYLTVPIMTTVLTVPRALYLEPQATPTFVGPQENDVVGIGCDGSQFSSSLTTITGATGLPSTLNGVQEISSYDGSLDFVTDGETEGNGNAHFEKFLIETPPAVP